jgi:hypothetical protein
LNVTVEDSSFQGKLSGEAVSFELSVNHSRIKGEAEKAES